MKERHDHVDLENPARPGIDDPAVVRRDRRARGKIQLSTGAALATIGILITAFTYDNAASGGGTYIVAYGPIIAGAITIVRGLVNLAR